MATLPSLSHIFVADDLSLKAVYSDNSLLLLASSGSTFTNVDPQGNSVTQLSVYAIKRFRARLAEIIKFRNLHVEPALTLPSLQSGSFCLGYRLSSVTWSSTIEAAVAEGQLRFQTDGSIVLDSEDSAARVVLHSNASRIAVCYPLLIPNSDIGQHQYSWQTQLFAVEEAPRRWQWPLCLLQQALTACSSQQQPSSETAQSRQQALRRTTDLPIAVVPDTVLSTLAKQSWWFDCNHCLPHDITILLEWTPDALYQYSPEKHEAAAWIHADESRLLSERQGSFLRHCKGDNESDRLYAAEAVPMHSSSQGSVRYPLAEFAEHALHLRHLCTCEAAVKRKQIETNKEEAYHGDNGGADSSHAGNAIEVHERHDVPDCGIFTAYKDGTVHVSFQDRTLLYLKQSQEHCDVITPDGHRSTVATAAPLGVELYVAQAMEFADWAFSSPSERAAVLKQAASIQKELGKCQRAVAFCEWASGQLALVPKGPQVISEFDSSCHSNSLEDSLMHRIYECCSEDTPNQDSLAQGQREQMIQALLAKSNHLLSTL